VLSVAAILLRAKEREPQEGDPDSVGKSRRDGEALTPGQGDPRMRPASADILAAVSTEAVVRPDAVGRAAGDVREVRPWPARLSTRLDPPVALTMTWVPLVLLLDRGAGIWWQRLLGLGTWVLLLALLRREVPLVRAQVAVVIVFATVVEYTFSPVLEVYVYRLDNVPAFVPPGHGLVYLCALAMGRSRWVRERLPACVALTVVAGGAYAGWGLLVSSRPDALGAFWFACLVGFLLWGRSRGLYVGAFVVVTYLEILGTWLGTWEWQAHDPTGIVSIGNPPAGAAGGYGWFDLAAVLAGPSVLAAATRLRARPQSTT
jgi:hypothetical protein